MSQLTTTDEPVRFFNVGGRLRDNASRASSFISRAISSIQSPSSVIESLPSGRMLGSLAQNIPVHEDTPVLGSVVQDQEDQETDRQMSGVPGYTSTHIQFARSPDRRTTSPHPEGENIITASASAETGDDRIVLRFFIKLRKRSRKILESAKGIPSKLGSKRTRNHGVPKERSTGPHPEMVANPNQYGLPTATSEQELAPTPSPVLPADAPDECKICDQCKEHYKELREQITLERTQQAASHCIEPCCVFIRENRISSPDIGIRLNGQDSPGTEIGHHLLGIEGWREGDRRQFDILPSDLTSGPDSRATTVGGLEIDAHEPILAPRLISYTNTPMLENLWPDVVARHDGRHERRADAQDLTGGETFYSLLRPLAEQRLGDDLRQEDIVRAVDTKQSVPEATSNGPSRSLAEQEHGDESRNNVNLEAAHTQELISEDANNAALGRPLENQRDEHQRGEGRHQGGRPLEEQNHGDEYHRNYNE